MKKRRTLLMLGACVLVLSTPLQSATVLKLSLGDMCARADKVFRGTVLGFSPGTVEAGGAALPAVTYRFAVSETFKGSYPEKDGGSVVEITMLGQLKRAPDGQYQALSPLPELPRFQVGQDYLLLTTPPSAVGLQTTVGLGQGAFAIASFDKVEWAVNGVNNQGLADGAMTYADLADQIRAELGE